MWIRVLAGLAIVYVFGSAAWLALGGVVRNRATELLNVSCDPTRELWRDLNEKFVADFEQQSGTKLTIKMSHGGSANQARSVIDGLPADVITLGLWSDTSAVHRRGLIDDDWHSRLPFRALPYYSTIVFVVRKGNPKQIADWQDIVRPGIEIVTPNPGTSGNGKLSFLAAWGAAVRRTGTEAGAKEFVTAMYRNVHGMETGARAATTKFAKNGQGDVHLTWENEAFLEVQESRGALEVVYPPVSIRAEPPVAVVDVNARRKGTKPAADAYMRFLYTAAAQDIIAEHRFRPSDPAAIVRHRDKFPDLILMPITEIAPDWDTATERFFRDGGLFDEILAAGKR